ncbi:3-hydroxybutyrate dehydrogenase [Litchfieldella qijiaojingensis]|uniref:3-hydroxybutyrate dehydrogenase n=1 Tax=Litchfieldella qijiaojingensis TaxID=980347 RepID=A0ABQ2Z9U1_9GAMM|nr:3-hydroxybutyrate dehydrogenase [Halomonas qijiaojingensis]GGY05944.1 3-hydroxybutyrate dehydrogenase [Halomonas qijiaojingensis]
MTLNGKICVVTGGASGIGLAIAKHFAGAGGKVALADIDIEGAEAAADELGQDHIAVEMDVTDPDAVQRGIDKVVDTFGGVDVLVSNAGVQMVKRVEEFEYAEWNKIIAIHLGGAFLTSKAVLPHMYRQGSGTILFMGSVHSLEASALKAPYVAAKHGLLGLARTIAKEGGSKGVRTNVLCPGFVKTPLVEKQIPEQAKDLGISEEEVINEVMLGETVDKEFTTVEDVAQTALFLASFPTNALTGQSIVVSHGWRMD